MIFPPSSTEPSDRPVLVVDADPHVQALLRAALERAGHRVVTAGDPRAAMRMFFDTRPRLVLLDVVLGEHDGWIVLERLRELSTDVPIMVVTARTGELERVRAFREGADQHLPKPFSVPELLACADALLRRARDPEVVEVHDDGFLRIDFRRAAVTAGDRPVHLTPVEFRLMTALARHAGMVLSADQLLDLAWKDAGTGSRSGDEVRVYIGYLRRKLRDAAGDESPISTVRGFGYCYAPPVAVPALA